MFIFKKRKFIKYLLRYTTALSEQINITDFMVDNFKRPDPTSTATKNETDKGVIFLKRLKESGIIDYNPAVLSQINNWYVDTDGKTKRWFDTLHEPMYVSLTDYYYNYYKNQSFFFRLSNKKFVLKQIKYAIRTAWKYSLKLFISIWKYLVGASLVYLGVGDHFNKVIEWIKNHL